MHIPSGVPLPGGEGAVPETDGGILVRVDAAEEPDKAATNSESTTERISSHSGPRQPAAADDTGTPDEEERTAGVTAPDLEPMMAGEGVLTPDEMAVFGGGSVVTDMP